MRYHPTKFGVSFDIFYNTPNTPSPKTYRMVWHEWMMNYEIVFNKLSGVFMRPSTEFTPNYQLRRGNKCLIGQIEVYGDIGGHRATNNVDEFFKQVVIWFDL